MYHEIERKFLITEMPNLKGIKKVSQERYFIQRGDLFEEGLKRKDSIFEYEAKFTLSKKERTREKIRITKEEFEKYKEKGTHMLECDSYRISQGKPIISVKKYKGIYKGLVLAEVKFDTVKEMEEFNPRTWMGKEVTGMPLGKDALLVDLDKSQFKKIVSTLNESVYPTQEGFL